MPGVAHHVTQRGNNRQDIFFTDADRRMYLGYLKESAARYGVVISSYCLMTNHIHVLATPASEDALSKALGRTHLMYAQNIHRLHGRLGHFWQNRFYSCPLDEAHAHNAAAYIELNPVRAGLAKRPWDYPWSSAAAHCAEAGDASGLLDLAVWFAQMSAREWKATLEALHADDAPFTALRMHTRTGRPLGDDSFISKIETFLGRRVRALPRGRPTASKDKAPRKKDIRE